MSAYLSDLSAWNDRGVHLHLPRPDSTMIFYDSRGLQFAHPHSLSTHARLDISDVWNEAPHCPTCGSECEEA
jgi:hypothetical protein